MATVNKDFRVKNGLVVEGTTGTINDSDIITAEAIENGAAENENISVTYDAESKKLTFVAENGVSGSTTDDLDEGENNLYYTGQRVRDEILNSQQENIVISEYDGQLIFQAENGVEDSTTDDLEEGETNLYYTDSRVYDKISSTLQSGTGILLDLNSEQEEIVLEVDTENIATVAFVESVAQGLKVRGNVEAATTENLNGTYNNGTNGVDATLNLGPLATFEVDGWSDWEEEDGILVKDQTNALENGRYFIFQVGSETEDWILKRCIRCDESEEIPGSFVFVQHGTQYGATGWVATVDNLGSFVVGTDDINWVQFSGAGTYVGGKGIEIDGQEIAIDFTEFDTDDIDEGDANLYYTDQRVRDVLVNSNQSNIVISEYDGQLIVEAEKGVENSTTDDLDEGEVNLYFTDQRAQDAVTENLTTDDLDEGEENLYFTDQRAVDALEAVTPNFTEIEINSVSKQIAATATLPGTSSAVVYSFDKTKYRSGKFLVKVSSGSHTEVSEVLVTLDTSDNIAITEYAIVGTNGNLGVITAVLNVNDVEITYTLDSGSGTATVFGTLIA